MAEIQDMERFPKVRTHSFCKPVWEVMTGFHDNENQRLSGKHGHFSPELFNEPIVIKIILFHVSCLVFITYNSTHLSSVNGNCIW